MAQYSSSEYQTSLETIGLSVKKFKTDCQDGGYGSHLGFLIGRILAIFYLQITLILITKFLLVHEIKFKTDLQDGSHFLFLI